MNTRPSIPCNNSEHAVLRRCQPHERSTPLTTLFFLGVKSGRLSLLLRALVLHLHYRNPLEPTSLEVLEDMRGFKDRPPASKPCQLPDSEGGTELGSEGVLLSFGRAEHGKLGHGDTQIHRTIPTLVEALQETPVRRVASMSTYALAVSAEGVPFVWGTGGSSAAVTGPRTEIFPQVLDALSTSVRVRDVSCGLGHALFLTDSGRVFSWGNGGNGRLGSGDTADRAEACLLQGLRHEAIVAIQAGASHSLALSESGVLYSWGKNTQGQCGVGTTDDLLRPTAVQVKGEGLSRIAAGWEHSLVLTRDGLVFSWGCGYKDSRRGVVPPVLGHGGSEGKTIPERISFFDSLRVTDIACGWDHCLALDEEGRVFSWGSGLNGKLGHGSESNTAVPSVIESLSGLRVCRLAAGCEHSAIVDSKGRLFTFGHGDGGRLGHGDSSPCLTPKRVEILEAMRLRTVQVVSLCCLSGVTLP